MKLIANPPTPAEVQRILELHAAGLTRGQIGAATGVNFRIVSAVTAAPERFDHYVDEVAVSRCLDGETGVWDRMTYPERNEILRRALGRRRREQAVNEEWSEFVRATSSSGFRARTADDPDLYPTPVYEPDWLVLLAEATGFRSTYHLMETARKNEKRRGQALAA